MREFFGGDRRDALETKREKQNFTIHKPKKTKNAMREFFPINTFFLLKEKHARFVFVSLCKYPPGSFFTLNP
jgi:hypothetical protein